MSFLRVNQSRILSKPGHLKCQWKFINSNGMLSWKIKLLKSEKSVGTWFAHSENAWTDCDLNKNTGALTWPEHEPPAVVKKRKSARPSGMPKALEAACQNANLSRTNSAIHKLRINPDRFWLVTNQYFQSTVCFTIFQKFQTPNLSRY